MSATSALWLWFSKQDHGTFGGDKIRDQNGPTMRSSQLDMMFEVVRRRRFLCGTVRTKEMPRDVSADGEEWGNIKVLERGHPPISKRRELTKIFEYARGDTTWPNSTQNGYRSLIRFLRSTMEHGD
jgi:hypothetical protein